MLLLIFLSWFLLGYLGCRIVGFSNEYLDFHAMETLFYLLCGGLTFVVSLFFIGRKHHE